MQFIWPKCKTSKHPFVKPILKPFFLSSFNFWQSNFISKTFLLFCLGTLSKSSFNEIGLVPILPITFPAALLARVKAFVSSILFVKLAAIKANTVSPAPETSYTSLEIVGENEVKKWGGNVLTLDFVRGLSSTNIIDKLKT